MAGGLAEHFGLDATLVRVAFVVLTLLTSGVGLVLYIAGWIVMPEQRDATSAAPRRASGGAVGGLLVGLLLVAVGVVWLLGEFDVDVPRWDVLLSVGLIVVGAAIVATAGRTGSGGLIVLGVIVSAILAGLSAFTFEADGAFGEQVERPARLEDLEREYGHAFGSLTVDLTDLDLPQGTTRIQVSTAFGEAIVRVPSRAAVRVEASTFFGESRVLGRTSSGIATNQVVSTPGYEGASSRLDIELNTAFGSATVNR